ncbi:uncharacterized protein LOC127523272 [Ctenopharyngodon idella]|uniref:uncharacterized protein LOC127523272 n=1 Tax=Ctenopharyngodon idella TaxID=7959 RepID=UPI002230CC8E|nr:uncharacterized protein LOC127523272 [Ctenopharyngodon idella]
MNAVNSVQLLILVWTFTAVCRADVDVSRVSCKDVTGTVGKEVTFTCSVPPCTECCTEKYKFLYPKKPSICEQKNTCGLGNSFTCRYTPTTAMTEKLIFYLQTKSGMKNTEFTVNITEPSKHEIVTEAPEPKTEGGPESRTEDNPGSNGTVIAAVVGCFIIIIIIIIIMTIIYKRKPNTNPCGFQRRMFLCLRYDEDNSNFQEQSPQNVINITESTV